MMYPMQRSCWPWPAEPVEALAMMVGLSTLRRWSCRDGSLLATRCADRQAIPRVVDLLLKVAHDAQVQAVVSPAFDLQRMPGPADLAALQRWRQVARVARHDDHPGTPDWRSRPQTNGARCWSDAGALHEQAGALDTPSDERVSSRPPGAGTASRPSDPARICERVLWRSYVLPEGWRHFVPTAREYRLGEDIYLLLSLPEDPQRYPVAGKVAWITPANASGGRTQGVGVRFPNDEKTRVLKNKIEETLGTTLQSAKATPTI
jgi:type IV pilus assembly protein PilZ